VININNNIGRNKEVSSVETREFQDSVRYELSGLYHKSLVLAGEIGTLSSMITLTDKSSVPIFRDYVNQIKSASAGLIINASSIRTDPSTIKEIETAESHQEYGCICSKRVDTVEVFTDSAGNLNKHIQVQRSISSDVDNEINRNIIENDPIHIFDKRIPYLITYVKPGIKLASVNINIYSETKLMKFNAIKYTPYPGIGSVVLSELKRDRVTNIKSINNTSLTGTAVPEGYTGINYDQYTMPCYLHTEVISTSNIKLGFQSNRYISDLGGIVIGLGSITAELNMYSQNSYAGYTIDVPTGKVMDSLEIRSEIMYKNTDNIGVRIYDNEYNFNNMNDSYLCRQKGTSSELNITPDANGKLYLLVDLTSTNNISPALAKLIIGYK